MAKSHYDPRLQNELGSNTFLEKLAFARLLANALVLLILKT